MTAPSSQALDAAYQLIIDLQENGETKLTVLIPHDGGLPEPEGFYRITAEYVAEAA